MARTPKCRRVCLTPICRRFESAEDPESKIERKTISIDVTEFEAIRLIDYVGLTQEEAARQMNVARTTVQRLYKNARKKLATFVVEGLCLNVEGGVYELCGRDRATCRKECRYPCPQRASKNDEKNAKIDEENAAPDAEVRAAISSK